MARGAESAAWRSPQSPLARLRQAKAESDRRNYAAKHRILRQLLTERPGEFTVDSRQGHIVGLTHRGTNFRIHAPARVLPAGFPKHAFLGPLLRNLARGGLRVARRATPYGLAAGAGAGGLYYGMNRTDTPEFVTRATDRAVDRLGDTAESVLNRSADRMTDSVSQQLPQLTETAARTALIEAKPWLQDAARAGVASLSKDIGSTIRQELPGVIRQIPADFVRAVGPVGQQALGGLGGGALGMMVARPLGRVLAPPSDDPEQEERRQWVRNLVQAGVPLVGGLAGALWARDQSAPGVKNR